MTDLFEKSTDLGAALVLERPGRAGVTAEGQGALRRPASLTDADDVEAASGRDHGGGGADDPERDALLLRRAGGGSLQRANMGPSIPGAAGHRGRPCAARSAGEYANGRAGGRSGPASAHLFGPPLTPIPLSGVGEDPASIVGEDGSPTRPVRAGLHPPPHPFHRQQGA